MTKKIKVTRPEPIRTHTQIIHFVGGVKRTIFGVLYVKENEMCHIYTEDGREWIINKANVLCVEVIHESIRQRNMSIL